MPAHAAQSGNGARRQRIAVPVGAERRPDRPGPNGAGQCPAENEEANTSEEHGAIPWLIPASERFLQSLHLGLYHGRGR